MIRAGYRKIFLDLNPENTLKMNKLSHFMTVHHMNSVHLMNKIAQMNRFSSFLGFIIAFSSNHITKSNKLNIAG